MKLTYLYVLLIISMLITAGCTTRSINPAPDNPAPENIVLGAFEPVMMIDVIVEDDVWDLKVTSVQFGTPTESIVVDRDLLIEVQDVEGETLYRYSKQDPRIIYEEEPPEYSNIIRMREGKLSIAIQYSPEIHSIVLIGQSPALIELRKNFDVANDIKRAYGQFEEQRKIDLKITPKTGVPTR